MVAFTYGSTHLRFFLFITFTLSGASAASASEVVDKADQILSDAAVGLITSQAAISSGVESTASTCSTEVGSGEPRVDEEIGVYSCSFSEAPETTPSPSPSSSPKESITPLPGELFKSLPGSLIFDLSSGNDNYPGHSGGGNVDEKKDYGHTFDLKISGAKVLEKKGALGKKGDKIGIEVGTELYSKMPEKNYSTYYKLANARATSKNTGTPYLLKGSDGVVQPVFFRYITVDSPDGKYPQQSMSRDYLKVFKEWNREKFTIIGEVTLETRDTKAKNFGSRVQNAWHSTGIADYTFVGSGLEGHPGAVTTTPVKETPPEGGTSTQAQPEKYVTIGGIPVVDFNVEPDILPTEVFDSYGNWATSVGGTVQRKKQIFRGTCELVVSVGAQQGIQGGRRLKPGAKVQYDPNSKVQVGSGIQASLLKNKKWNDSRLTFDSGVALIYFPRPVSGSSWDWNANASIKGNFHTDKQGNIIQTAIQFYGPGLGGAFRDIDDKEAIFNLSVRYILTGKKK